MASRQLRVFIVGDADSAAKAAGQVEKRFGTMGSKLGAVGDKIAKAFRVGAVGAAAAITGTLAKAVTSGWRRLQSLENAEKMFDQMGLSADDTKRIMDGLNDTLTGTAFALDEGAGAMAALVSAGVGLDDVNRQMDLIADAAAYGQTDLAGVADIFRKVESGGRATRRELEQLTTRGIPAFSLLASGLEMTGEEFDKFVADGQLNAEVFVDAWEKGAKGFGEANIVMEGAAKSMGDTVSGAWGNVQAALARFGAVLVGPIFRAMPAILAAATDGLNKLKDASEGFVEGFVEKLSGLDLSRFWDILKGAVPILKDLGQALLNVGEIAMDLLPLGLAAFATGLEVAFAALRPVASLIESVTGWLADHSGLVFAAAAAWATWKGVGLIVDGIVPKFKSLYDGVRSFFSIISSTAATKGVSRTSAALGSLKQSASEANTGLATLAKGGAGLAVAAGFGLMQVWKKAGDQAKAAIAEMKEGMDDTSMSSIADVQEGIRAKLEATNAELNKSSGFWGDLGWSVAATGQGLLSMTGQVEPTMLNTLRASEELTKELEVLAAQLVDLEQTYLVAGAAMDGVDLDPTVSWDPETFKEFGSQAEKWAQNLGLTADEVTRLHQEGKLPETLAAARDAALNGTPAMDTMAAAIETLSDETADSTERLKAWKDMIDAAIGPQKNVTDSTIAYKNELASLEEKVKENAGTFDINTAAGRENLSGLSSLIDRTVDLAGAIGEQTGSTEFATAALASKREEIIKGLESVMSRREAEKLLADQFNFSADALNDVAIKATNARRGIEDIPSHKRILIEWDEIKRTTVMEQRLSDWEQYGRHYARRHTGGIFRASRPGGEGLALLRDRERVMTPTQQGPPQLPERAGVSYTTNVVVHVEGSVLAEEDLTTAVIDGINTRQGRSATQLLRGV